MELLASHQPDADEPDAYEQLLGDALRGETFRFAREDYVEEAWRIVDPVLTAETPLFPYEPGSLGTARSGSAGGSGAMARPVPGARAAGDTVRTEVLPDPGAVAIRAAERIAQVAREAVAERGRCALAFSGGTTPWQALRALSGEDLPWDRVHLFQVDERVAPFGDPERNYFHLREALIDRIAIPPANVHPMPVEDEDLDEGAAATNRFFAGLPERRRFSTSSSSGWGRTATRPPSSRATRRSRPSTRTSPSPAFTRDDGG